jgi:hypothetical protein
VEEHVVCIGAATLDTIAAVSTARLSGVLIGLFRSNI